MEVDNNKQCEKKHHPTAIYLQFSHRCCTPRISLFPCSVYDKQ